MTHHHRRAKRLGPINNQLGGENRADTYCPDVGNNLISAHWAEVFRCASSSVGVNENDAMPFRRPALENVFMDQNSSVFTSGSQTGWVCVRVN